MCVPNAVVLMRKDVFAEISFGFKFQGVMGGDRTAVVNFCVNTFLIQRDIAFDTEGGETKQVGLIFWRHAVKHCAVSEKKADNSDPRADDNQKKGSAAPPTMPIEESGKMQEPFQRGHWRHDEEPSDRMILEVAESSRKYHGERRFHSNEDSHRVVRMVLMDQSGTQSDASSGWMYEWRGRLADLLGFLGLSAHEAVGLFQRGTAESPSDTLIRWRKHQVLVGCTVWTGWDAHRWPTRRRALEPVCRHHGRRHSALGPNLVLGEHHALTTGWSHGLLFLRGQVHHDELVGRLPPPCMQDLLRKTPVQDLRGR